MTITGCSGPHVHNQGSGNQKLEVGVALLTIMSSTHSSLGSAGCPDSQRGNPPGAQEGAIQFQAVAAAQSSHIPYVIPALLQMNSGHHVRAAVT